jgi:hypothetical protein
MFLAIVIVFGFIYVSLFSHIMLKFVCLNLISLLIYQCLA